MTAKSKKRECTTTCRSFRCEKRHLKIIRKEDKKQIICTMDGDDIDCMGYMCKYAQCQEKHLKSDGTCLKPVKRQPQKRTNMRYSQVPTYFDDDFDDEIDHKILRKVKKL